MADTIDVLREATIGNVLRVHFAGRDDPVEGVVVNEPVIDEPVEHKFGIDEGYARTDLDQIEWEWWPEAGLDVETEDGEWLQEANLSVLEDPPTDPDDYLYPDREVRVERIELV